MSSNGGKSGPQNLLIGQLVLGFLQFATASAPVMADSEVQQQANHIVNAAAYGRQADLDLWAQQLVMTSQQCHQWQRQQAQQMQWQQQHQQVLLLGVSLDTTVIDLGQSVFAHDCPRVSLSHRPIH